MSESVLGTSFEVFGTVQGVSFRMYTKRKADAIGIRGWCMNTQENTVKGEIQGSAKAFEEMKYWLQNTGSPSSRIDKCIFGEVKQLTNLTYENFSIRNA